MLERESHDFLGKLYNCYQIGKLCLQLTCFLSYFLTFFPVHAGGIIMEIIDKKSSKLVAYFISFFH